MSESRPDPLVQITKRTGRIPRVDRSETPVIELHLVDGQYVASVSLERDEYSYRSDRKTVDWRWTAYVVTPLGPPHV